MRGRRCGRPRTRSGQLHPHHPGRRLARRSHHRHTATRRRSSRPFSRWLSRRPRCHAGTRDGHGGDQLSTIAKTWRRAIRGSAPGQVRLHQSPAIRLHATHPSSCQASWIRSPKSSVPASPARCRLPSPALISLSHLGCRTHGHNSLSSALYCGFLALISALVGS